MKVMSAGISDDLAAFVDTQVKKGRYRSPDDVVRAGLRLLQERESKLEALRAALIEGEQSGPSMPFDFETFIAEKRGTRKPAV